MSAELLAAESSYGALSSSNPTRRPLRAPGLKRPKSFHDAFDARTLFYDCFWRDGGISVYGGFES